MLKLSLSSVHTQMGYWIWVITFQFVVFPSISCRAVPDEIMGVSGGESSL